MKQGSIISEGILKTEVIKKIWQRERTVFLVTTTVEA
jgi:hypothetical protein